jgi:DNA-binding MarR family transcriptional regulator
MKKTSNTLVSFHEPVDGKIELHREQRHYMPKGYEYIILFQQTLENVLTYKLNKVELSVFMFVLSQVGFENNLIMPGLQQLCAKRTCTHQPDVSKALRKLCGMNIIIKENLPDTKSFRYRVNYSLVAKTTGANITPRFHEDRKIQPIAPSKELKLFE